MIRKIVVALLLVPLALVIIVLAVANRQSVTLSLDPFGTGDPALAVALPLYQLIFALIIAGVVLGGVASWLRQGRWRRAARQAQAEARVLRAEADDLRRAAVRPAPQLMRPPAA